jgi:hypothetical protein
MPVEVSGQFKALYPKSIALGLVPVVSGPGQHVGFDCIEVAKALGAERYAALAATLKHVFVCGHARYPADYPNLAGTEVHCIYAADLERFLEQE